MKNLFIFSTETNRRIYKFSVFADSNEAACEIRNKIINLYLVQSARFAQSVKLLGIVLNDVQRQIHTARTNETGVLAQDHRVFRKDSMNVRVLTGEEIHGDFFGRNFDSGWVGMAVFDFAGVNVLDQFTVKTADFDVYSQHVDEKIKDLINANSPASIENINKYVDAFFSSNPPGNTGEDVLKLIADRKLLREKYLSNINFEVLDERQYVKIAGINQYIEQQSRAFAASPISNVTPLMRCVSRPVRAGAVMSDELDQLELQVKDLIARGADVNAVDVHGRTALMYVVLGENLLGQMLTKGRERFAKLLVDNDADVSIKDKFGKTALDYFREYIKEADHPAIRLLESAVLNNKAKEAGPRLFDGSVTGARAGSEKVNNVPKLI
jgi:hypothetical protein